MINILNRVKVRDVNGFSVRTNNTYYDNIINDWLIPLSKRYDIVLDWNLVWIDNPFKKYVVTETDSSAKMIAFGFEELGEISEQFSDRDIIIIVCDNYGNIQGKSLDYDSQMYILSAFDFAPIEFFMNDKRIECVPMLYTGTKAGRGLLRVFRESTYKNYLKITN